MAKAEERQGLLEITDKGAGFLRDPGASYRIQSGDPFVPPALIKKYKLRTGQLLQVLAQPGRRGGFAATDILAVNDLPPLKAAKRKLFGDLTSVSPTKRIRLETGPEPLSMRLVDLVAPIGRGTRGLIVAAPKTGKTTLLKEMAAAVSRNHPDIYLIALGIDERPEEATDLRRSIKGEVHTSSLDHDPAEHRRLASLVAAAARARVEAGQDVFLILDSITRLARAFNSAANSKGRTLSGGLDSQAMAIPRQIFGSARATEEAGSLTIIATCLVDTGSRMDELIFQEFKGTGNMELALDRSLAELRVWPAVNIPESGTRREELLHDELERRAAPLLRRALTGLRPAQATDKLIQALARHASNADLLATAEEVAAA